MYVNIQAVMVLVVRVDQRRRDVNETVNPSSLTLFLIVTNKSIKAFNAMLV